MGRLQKATVDYFPHDAHASDGQTVTILENHFGLEGYATWFKLLERLSGAANHFICAGTDDSLEYLAAKLHLKPDRMVLILDKLAELGAIDPELWRSRMIWSQNLVERLKVCYEKRKQGIPNKPNISGSEMPISGSEMPISGSEIPPPKIRAQSIPITPPKSKGKESKVNEREGGKTCPYPDILSAWIELVPSLPKPQLKIDISSSRAAAMRARWEESPDIEVFKEIFRRVEASPFLKGENDRGWKANFDWVLLPSKWQGIMEGNYDQRKVAVRPSPDSPKVIRR